MTEPQTQMVNHLGVMTVRLRLGWLDGTEDTDGVSLGINEGLDDTEGADDGRIIPQRSRSSMLIHSRLNAGLIRYNS